MNIEELAKKFIALASKSTLSKAEQEEARDLMRQLKEAGMSNEEISKLSKGKWTPSTIKFYTPGIKAADPSPWQDTISLLENIISKGMTLEDVELAANVDEYLRNKGLTLEQIIDLVIDADSDSVNLRTLVSMHKELKESGLSFKDVAETLSFKKQLEERNLTIDSLAPLVELAKNYGEPAQVIEAFSQYTSLIELKEKISAANSELESVNLEQVSANQHLDETQSELSRIQESLKAYDEVNKLGFSEPELLKLSNLAKKHGTVKKVLNAVEAYADYAEINEGINEAKTKLSNIEAKIGQLEISYSHLKTATSMCDALIHQYKFGLDAISTIYSMAKKYGEPLDVLKAIEAYGKLQVLQHELDELGGQVTQCKELLAQLQGEYRETLDSLESLNTKALQVGAEMGKVEGELAASRQWRTLMNLIKSPAVADYVEHGPTVLSLAVALLKWISSNEGRFKSSYDIKAGLQSLIKQLGGVW